MSTHESFVTSDKTVQKYRKRATSLVQRFYHETGADFSKETHLFVGWLADLRSTLRKSSWRQYRTALCTSLEPKYPQLAAQIKELSTDLCLQTKRKKAPNRSSSNKQKTLTKQDLTELVNYLNTTRSRLAPDIKNLLIFGYLCGLRPSEWLNARVMYVDSSKTDVVLHVKNAKNSNLRAHGEYRTIHLTNIGHERIKRLHRFVEKLRKTVASEYDGDMDKYTASCASQLWRVTRRLWPNRSNHPSLYTVRHQFSADAKASGLSRVEIAALMGHASDETAGRHYGKRRSGRSSGSFRVQADEGDMERVRRMAKTLEQRMGSGNDNAPKPFI